MGRRTRMVAVVMVTMVVVGVTASPVGAQEPGDVVEVVASFDGGCVDTSNVPSPGPPPGGSASLIVPTTVEAGATIVIPVTAIDGHPGPLGRETRSATFAVTGATPASVTSSAFAFEDYSPLILTVTAAAGSVVEIRLTATTFAAIASLPDIHIGYLCGAPGGAEVTVRIPIAAPMCLGQAATLVGPVDATRVVGTAGDDVIVARAPGATIVPGGGHDLVCALAGDGTISYADAAHGVIMDLSRGLGGDAGGGTVRFDGIANLEGSPRPDLLIGDDSANTLRGGRGSDVLVGLAGADRLDGQAGADVLIGDPTDTCTSGISLGC